MNKTILTITSFFLLSISTVTGQHNHNHEHELKLVNPKYSPNGDLILASSEKYNGLYLLDANTFEIKNVYQETSNVGYGATWSVDGKSIFYRYKEGYAFKTNKLDLASGKSFAVDANPLKFTCKAFYTNKNEYPFLTDKNNIQYKNTVIGEDGDNYYHLVSNANNTVFVAHKGSQIVLIDNNNQETIDLTDGLANAISPDGRYVYFHRDYSNDGHFISGAELFAYDLKNNAIFKLTNTPDTIELWPDVSPDGKFLLYSDDKTGEIGKISLNLEK